MTDTYYNIFHTFACYKSPFKVANWLESSHLLVYYFLKTILLMKTIGSPLIDWCRKTPRNCILSNNICFYILVIFKWKPQFLFSKPYHKFIVIDEENNLRCVPWIKRKKGSFPFFLTPHAILTWISKDLTVTFANIEMEGNISTFLPIANKINNKSGNND